MQKYLRTCLAVSAFLILGVSCVKDRLNEYDPNALKAMVLELGIEDAYVVNVGSVLNLDAKVKQSEAINPGNLEYRWSYYTNTAYTPGEATVVGNSAHLDLVADMPTGSYTLVLEVTDTTTGVKEFKKIKLQVKRFTSEGWLILTEKNNKANLSIVSSDYTTYKDFLPESTIQGMEGRPVQLFCVNDWDAEAQPIIVKTDKPEIYFLNYNTFEVLANAEELFVQPPLTNFRYFATDMYFNQFYLFGQDGLIYNAERNFSAPPNAQDGYNQPLMGDYNAMNLVLPGLSVSAAFYDLDGKRFLLQPYGATALEPFIPKPADAPFDLSNFTDRILYNEVAVDYNNYLLAENAEGKVRLFVIDLMEPYDVYPAKDTATIDPGNGAKPSMFAFSGKLPIMYYIAGNGLYLYKMMERSSKLLYTFPASESITDMKMLRETIMQDETKNPAVNNRLAIAANEGENGIFYTFDLSPTGALSAGKYSSREEGFAKIISIVYKEPK